MLYYGNNNSFFGSGDEVGVVPDHVISVWACLCIAHVQVSSVGDTDSAFSTEGPSISSPSPQLVANGYSEYVADGKNEDS